MERNFIVTLARFHRRDQGRYVVQGFFMGNSIAGSRMRAYADDKELKLDTSMREGLAIRRKYFSRGIGYENIDREYDLWITLPEDLKSFRTLKLTQTIDNQTRTVYRIGSAQLARAKKMPDGYLETWKEHDGKISIGGWAVGNSPCRVQVLGRGQEKLPSEVTWHYRQDIVGNYPELTGTENYGFEITFDKPDLNYITLLIAADGQRMETRLNVAKGEKNVTAEGPSMMTKAVAYFKRNGLRMTGRRVIEKLQGKAARSSETYMTWRKNYIPTREELDLQRKNVFLNRPLISIVVPLYKTPENYLRELVRSIREQTYDNWQLVLSDGSGAGSPLENILNEFERDDRIKVVRSDVQLHISENTNAALAACDGDFIAFADHDDTIAPEALYEFVKVINEEPEVDFIYSDEDKVSMKGDEYFEPHFKSDFNIDLLCSMNYICHMVVVRRDLQQKVGGLDPAYDGAQDYDFVLRCVENAAAIRHISKALYHWRSHQDSTAANPESKRYAFEAGMRAVLAHYDRAGISADVIMGQYPGLYRTIYRMPEKKPLVSIIIPNKDHIPDLDKCVAAIQTRATYDNYEFIVVENNSTDEGTFEYYRSMEQKYDNFHTVYWDREFNYSLINNFGAQKASGEYLLFLNNDTEIISENFIEEMLGPCMRKEVGICGARLYYGDDTIQHAGVIIGYGGIAGHAFNGMARTANGYFSRIICQSDLSAVTAACMMVRRDVFEEVKGLDETLAVAFNDVDFCLRVREHGYLVVYDPFCELYHYESKSRGAEDTPEKIARFNKEADLLLKRYPQILENGDPYYNVNLSLDRVDFSLR